MPTHMLLGIFGPLEDAWNFNATFLPCGICSALVTVIESTDVM